VASVTRAIFPRDARRCRMPRVNERPHLVACDIELSTPFGPVRAVIEIPERARLSELVRALWSLDERLVDAAVQEDVRDGTHSVTCCKGCGACCRQLVPLSAPEAFALAELVESLPDDRRAEILDRFARAKEQVERAGFFNVRFDRDQLQRAAVTYFSAGSACPFLEDEACSIHLERPIVCREFLATSPAEHCGEIVLLGAVRCVPMPVRIHRALEVLAAEVLDREPCLVPLVECVEWTRAHRDDAERTFDGATLVRRLVQICAASVKALRDRARTREVERD
jgi:Fe-S-cluster containining protein